MKTTCKLMSQQPFCLWADSVASQQPFLPSAAAREMSRPQRSLQPLANARANMKATGMRALPPPALLTVASGVGAKGRVGLEPEADQALK